MNTSHCDGGHVMVIRRKRTLAHLDRFGLSLANKGHVWTPRERCEFEKRIRELSKLEAKQGNK